MSWQKQQPDQALFEEVLWAKPENKHQAGKLLVIGGSEHGFLAVAESYMKSLEQGIGECKAVLPDSLKKSLLPVMTNVEYTKSTPSGSFAS